MRAIYSAAQDTIIYLGDEDGGNTCNSAWNFLERSSQWAMNENHDTDYGIPTTKKDDMWFRGDLEDVEIDVLGRAWFRRVWVFQEVVVSKTLSIQCGYRKISWDDFCKILLLSPRYHDQYGISLGRGDRVEVVRDMFQARCSYQETHHLEHLRPSWYAEVESYKGQNSYILNTLSRARRLESSDPRDKIFALLGVSTGIDLDDKRLVIDYRKPCNEVYTNFARYIMEITNSYNLLSYLDDNAGGLEPETSLDTDSDSNYVTESNPLLLFHELQRLTKNILKRQKMVIRDRDFISTTNGAGLRVMREILPNWVPNWDRSGSAFSEWDKQYISRTILSTLEAESEAQRAERNLVVGKSRIWTDDGNTLAAIGFIIGQVAQVGPTIALQGKIELAFQDIRDQYSDDQFRLTQDIMALWAHFFTEESTVHLPKLKKSGRFHPSKTQNFLTLND